mmetsp:Transcript_137/g.354  ORF Transcript_137/g.354 Transcript_137/m.354 type:complete len:151 (-) Transcript_137:108-560(-)
MLRLSQTSRRLVQRAAVRKMSSSTNKSSILEGDSGGMATHVHHTMTTFLAVTAPMIFVIPDSWSDGIVAKSLGLVVAATISAHSWIGLNYVATDYVPKISKSLLGPARFVNAGIAGITLLGLGAIALNNKGGIKGTIMGPWNPKKEEKKE